MSSAERRVAMGVGVMLLAFTVFVVFAVPIVFLVDGPTAEAIPLVVVAIAFAPLGVWWIRFALEGDDE